MSTTIKHRIGVLTATTVALVIAWGVAWAANPHFVGKVTAELVGNDVQVCWKEAGIGNNQLIEYEASANATATFHCVNNPGNCPNAANKQDVSGPVSSTGAFQSGKNGQITQCLTISSSQLSPDPFCPSGQTQTLTDFSFTNIQITDLTNNVTKAATPSSFSATVFVCPNP